MFFPSAEIAAALQLWELIGTRYGKLRAPGVDALCRKLQVVVLLDRRADKFLQLRVLEDLPPGKIGIGRCLSLDLGVFAQITEGRWRLNDRPMVVRADLTSGEGTGGQHCDHQ